MEHFPPNGSYRAIPVAARRADVLASPARCPRCRLLHRSHPESCRSPGTVHSAPVHSAPVHGVPSRPDGPFRSDRPSGRPLQEHSGATEQAGHSSARRTANPTGEGPRVAASSKHPGRPGRASAPDPPGAGCSRSGIRPGAARPASSGNEGEPADATRGRAGRQGRPVAGRRRDRPVRPVLTRYRTRGRRGARRWLRQPRAPTTCSVRCLTLKRSPGRRHTTYCGVVLAMST